MNGRSARALTTYRLDRTTTDVRRTVAPGWSRAPTADVPCTNGRIAFSAHAAARWSHGHPEIVSHQRQQSGQTAWVSHEPRLGPLRRSVGRARAVAQETTPIVARGLDERPQHVVCARRLRPLLRDHDCARSAGTAPLDQLDVGRHLRRKSRRDRTCPAVHRPASCNSGRSRSRDVADLRHLMEPVSHADLSRPKFQEEASLRCGQDRTPTQPVMPLSRGVAGYSPGRKRVESSIAIRWIVRPGSSSPRSSSSETARRNVVH